MVSERLAAWEILRSAQLFWAQTIIESILSNSNIDFSSDRGRLTAHLGDDRRAHSKASCVVLKLKSVTIQQG
jgi:hypothetical protein